MSLPGVNDVIQITAFADGVVRNLQITQCYHEFSQALARQTGREANWCTFATWASKQAGQTIRGEDLARTVEELFEHSPGIESILARIQREVERLGVRRDMQTLREQLLSALDPRAALQSASAAVARGNLKVFEEIGLAFACFLATFEDGQRVDTDKIQHFCATLRPGEPPEGQRLLREAFAAYGEACTEGDPKARAEQLFFANLLVGLHEQTRLQPEISAAMDASFGDVERTRDRLLEVLLPGWWLRIRLRVARLLKRQLPLDVAIDGLIDHVRMHVRRVVTEALLTLHVSEEQVLRLGRDLDASFAPMLERLAHPKLTTLLAAIDPTPNSTSRSGTSDWSNLQDRMHFITDFFRCYHAWEPLFDAPFRAGQVADLKAGRRPDGRL